MKTTLLPPDGFRAKNDPLAEPTRRRSRSLGSELGALVALIVLVVTFTLLNPRFGTWDNFVVVSRQVSILAIMAVGMTLVIITAGIDLGVGSLAALSAVTVATLIADYSVPAFLAILIAVALLALIGLLVGSAISLLGLQPFIVTLAVYAGVQGIAKVIASGSPVRFDSKFLINIGTGSVGPIPIPVIIAAVALVIGQIVLTRTRYGRYIYAIGGNAEAARVSGVPVKVVTASVYTISAATAAIAGVILAGRLHSGDPFAGPGFELDVIAAVVIGGTSLFGGIGNMRGSLIGVFIIGVISNGLTILNVQSFWQDVAKGAVILIATLIDAYFRRRSVN